MVPFGPLDVQLQRQRRVETAKAPWLLKSEREKKKKNPHFESETTTYQHQSCDQTVRGWGT